MQNNFKKCSSKSLKELIKMGGSNNSIELARIYADRYGKSKSASNLLYNYYHLITNTKFLSEDMYDFFVNGLSYNSPIILIFNVTSNQFPTVFFFLYLR